MTPPSYARTFELTPNPDLTSYVHQVRCDATQVRCDATPRTSPSPPCTCGCACDQHTQGGGAAGLWEKWK